MSVPEDDIPDVLGLGSLTDSREAAEEYRDSVGFETPIERSGPLPADPDPDEGDA